MRESNLILYGRREETPEAERMRAGPLRLLYESTQGWVRRVRWNGLEVLRGIYAAVRDRDWETVPGIVTETRHEMGEEAFQVEFECRHQRREIDFTWRGTVSGSEDGRLSYVFDGVARSTFLRNRIGLCVLHPVRECAGARARQIRVDGRRVEGCFPDLIEPQIIGQGTFRELRAMSHEVEPGVWATVTFEGDIFETEDQRNWTDASLKTYSTPLSLPFPVEIKAGTRIRQVVSLHLEGWEAKPARRVVEPGPRVPRVVKVEPGAGAVMRLPTVGLGAASHGVPTSEHQISRLRRLGVAHLRVDLRLSASDWVGQWERAAQEASQIGGGLELAVHLPRESCVDASGVSAILATPRTRVARVLALREGEAATSATTLDMVRRIVDGLHAPVGAGSDANFCELNRERALGRCAVDRADFVFWSINPQVHVHDDASVMENLEAQSATVRTARSFSDGKPMVVTPVTLRRRFNAVSTGVASPELPGELPPQVDPRQAGLFAAAWTLGSLVELGGAGVDAVTYFETTGWRGVMELASGSPLPNRFPSTPGAVFPLYHVFEAMSSVGGGEVLPVTCTEARTLAVLSARCHSKRILLMANLEPEMLEVEVVGFPDLDFGWMYNLDILSAARGPAAGWARAARRGEKDRIQVPSFGLVLLSNREGVVG
ncbi:MAG: hypothetical protein JNK85_30320 [Verrucomicrobiales bacterium]|nr:hypothetical protein [Verrucomicrobiales bacterium]